MRIEVTERKAETRYSTGMEAGDFVPNFYIENGERKLDIQVRAGNHVLLCFIHPDLSADEIRQCLSIRPGLSTAFITERATALADARLFHDANVYRLFMSGETRYGLYLCSPNLKIVKTLAGDNLPELLAGLPRPGTLDGCDTEPPILIVPNVISEALTSRLIVYLNGNKETSSRNTGTYKSRSHIHPSRELELELDNKLCKSMLPEISKVYYSDVSYRETYKICCYDAAEKGTFGKHRDTIHPHLHRRYALTLVLNDDFDGGGICFPEYSDRIIHAPKCSAIIFPGSLYHQVKEIGRGLRYVIVSFLFTQAEARLKPDSQRYRFLVQRDMCNIKINRLSAENDEGLGGREATPKESPD